MNTINLQAEKYIDNNPIYKKDCCLDTLCVGILPVKWIQTNATLLTDLNYSSGAVKKAVPLEGIFYNGIQLYRAIQFQNPNEIKFDDFKYKK